MFELWLNTIYMFARNAPVIIVGTCLDHFDTVCRKFTQEFQSLHNKVGLGQWALKLFHNMPTPLVNWTALYHYIETENIL